MCGFIAAKAGTVGTNEKIRRRGEDATSILEARGHVFVHNLLSLTGSFTPQPFVDGGVFCVYNGEIYNQPFDRSDGECLIPLYRRHGPEFTRGLDGEFAIALFDFESGTAVFSTDAFRTKPIYLNADGAASYPSGLAAAAKAMPPNTTVVRDLASGRDRSFSVHDFDFDHQDDKTYDRWIAAFEGAVLKRAAKKRTFLGLSSGYDSGAIHCALRRLHLDHEAFSIAGSENLDVLAARGAVPMRFSRVDYEAMRARLRAEMEDFEYKVFDNAARRLHDEDSAFAMAFIMLAARERGIRIYLSGQGADEIISDYAPWGGQSEFRGRFPEKLRPWKNFYGHCQEAYLAKEEHVGGTFSVETRYPFLDLDVVQAFLSLHVDWKNRHYKAPIREYFLGCGYPFRENEKLGFNPQARL